MKLVVGLGNPGKQYENTRHNVGYMVIDKIKSKKLKIKNVTFAKTGVFMNESGKAVKKLIENLKLKIENLYIVHDDLDIPLGQFKIQFARGPKDHNGVRSVEEELGTPEFWRIRVGVENRKVPEVSNVPKVPKGEEYVLQEFTGGEKKIIDGVVEKIAEKL